METEHRCGCSNVLHLVLILPMRNGNVSSSSQKISFNLCSYPTYEEWKLAKVSDKRQEIVGSYPTYEEWKLSPSFTVINTVFGSYPTYEEWKP
mgnify:CR=1 FL=1